MILPDWTDKPTNPLEKFIYHNEPAGGAEEEAFRKQLAELIEYLLSQPAQDACICTQLTALEPTVNPDCSVHGSLKG